VTCSQAKIGAWLIRGSGNRSSL